MADPIPLLFMEEFHSETIRCLNLRPQNVSLSNFAWHHLHTEKDWNLVYTIHKYMKNMAYFL